jgi:hypothetical protein
MHVRCRASTWISTTDPCSMTDLQTSEGALVQHACYISILCTALQRRLDVHGHEAIHFQNAIDLLFGCGVVLKS